MDRDIDTVVLVRHGRTGWNRERRFRGRTDLPLDDVGREQAEATGVLVAGLAPRAAIVSSPLRRALETAAPIGRRTGRAVRPAPGFLAMSFGAWEGCSAPEVAARWPDQYRLWLERPVAARPEGGETLDDVRTRAASAVDRALAEAGAAAAAPDEARSLVVVAHTVVNRMIALHLLGLDTAQFWSLALRPCGVSVLRRVRAGWTVELWNATHHLPGRLDDGPEG